MTKNNSSDNLRELVLAIDGSPVEQRPCICGGRINRFIVNACDRWICEACCGAAGETYEDAVTEKLKYDLHQIALKARNFIKDTQFLISLQKAEVFVTIPQAGKKARG